MTTEKYKENSGVTLQLLSDLKKTDESLFTAA